jgi:uncharacterized OB-fold protein
MVDTKGRPAPKPTLTTEPFWTAVRNHRLVLQYCTSCKTYQHYPRPFCVRCLDRDLEWREVSGRGRVYSFTVVRQAANESFSDLVPYVLAIVELDEGPRLLTNIIGCNVDAVRIEMPVRVAFQDLDDAVGLAVFEPEGLEPESE